MTAVEPPDGEALRDALREALGDVFARFGELPTRWVLVAETLGGDGERGLWLTTHEGAKPWDTLGMMAFADALERSEIRREA